MILMWYSVLWDCEISEWNIAFIQKFDGQTEVYKYIAVPTISDKP